MSMKTLEILDKKIEELTKKKHNLLKNVKRNERILQLKKAGVKVSEIAAIYGIDSNRVYQIVKR